jgi:valyl-tRNA synthetase
LHLHADEVSSFEKVRELVSAIRVARASQNVSPKREIELITPLPLFALATSHSIVLSSLAGLGSIIESNESSSGFAIPFDGEMLLLANMFDESETEANTEKLQEEICELEKQIAGFKDRLANASYINNAPDHVVQETRDMLKRVEADLAAAKAGL